MFLLKRIHKSYIQNNYCNLCTARILNNQIPDVQNIPNSEKDELDEYEEKLLFNSVLDKRRLRHGYKKNAEIMAKRTQFEKRMKTALQTIQPLPLTLKYASKEVSLPKETKNTQIEESCLNSNLEESKLATNFPYKVNAKIGKVGEGLVGRNSSIQSEMAEKKRLLDKDKENWMTHYENYEQDLFEHCETKGFIDEIGGMKINYGTPDPDCPISDHPCGGCGAHLHCKDTAIPGYIPSEIFKNAFKPGGSDLGSILCQRCHFLKEYNIALQVRVSPSDYPKVLKAISFNTSLAVLMIDLTDFPCSIWPGIADILGRAPVFVVGNKVDLLPKDSPKFLQRIKKLLLEHLKLSGFATSNIKHIELISAKTGYGVESFITSLQSVWKRKGDVYLIGCTNVGKSSLFNQLLKSDFCKIQAADHIQRAATSVWPGTTLNLLKFPITKFSGYRVYVRQKRLEKLQKLESIERNLQAEALQEQNIAQFATLKGHIERTQYSDSSEKESLDSFTSQGKGSLTGLTEMGINESLPEFVHGKWCYDTPGVVHPDQILHLLTADELMQTLPKEIIRPETFCVKPGTSLFIAGLARLDYIQGPNSIRLTVFRSNSLPITICHTSEADRLYSELLGRELFAVPIFKGDRAEKWPGLALAKSFKVVGTSIKDSSYDVVLSSAGWIAINCGQQSYEFKAWTPEKRGVHLRESLLPKAVTLRGARIRDSVAYRKHRFIL